MKQDDYFWGELSEEDIEGRSTNKTEGLVEVDGNRIYFYRGITQGSILELNKILQQKTRELLVTANDIGVKRPKLYLHINSGGGIVLDALAACDTILRLKKDVDIITVVDGRCASAATFISLVGTKRIISSHGMMLIHQISGGAWGKYKEIKDQAKNVEKIMEVIKNLYKQYTKVPMKDLDEILDHDIWWDTEKCLELGLVDEVI